MNEEKLLEALEKDAEEQEALLKALKANNKELESIDKDLDFDRSWQGMTKTDFAVLKGAIDADNATISGVSVITVGEARGHGMQVDSQTLAEVKAAAETYAGGLKVKTDHFSGFNQIVGTLKNFKITGDQLRADLFLLKNHDATARILEMAELMPDTFGLSISFTGEHEESDNDIVFARCTEIYSADLVDAPAANPTGLFSAKVDSEKKDMDEKQFAEALSAALAPINDKLSAFEAFMALEAGSYECTYLMPCKMALNNQLTPAQLDLLFHDLEREVKNSNPRATYNYGLVMEHAGNQAKAIQLLQLAMDLGIPEARAALSRLLMKGA